MHLHTKRIYDPPAPEDGYRLLVMLLWPRGIRKDKIDAWNKDLAPSEKLRRTYIRGGLAWEVYAKAYLEEMISRQEPLAEVARRAQKQTVTLLCSCQDESRCHRTLLKGLVEAADGS